MSDNEQTNKKIETVADILEEMRGMGNYQRYSGEHAHALADRIEAAWKRQEQCYLDQIRDAVNMIGHERFVKEHPPSGNSAAKKRRRTKTYDPAKTLHDYWRDHYEV